MGRDPVDTSYKTTLQDDTDMQASPLITEFNSFLKDFRMCVTQDNHAHYLEVDHFRAMPWRKPQKNTRLKKKPNLIFYEEKTTALISFLLQKYDISTFMDIGAENGYFCELCLSFDPRPLDVFAFEMRPGLHATLQARLSRAVRAGQRAEAFCAGISDSHQGQVTVWYSITKLFETKPDPSAYRDPWWRRLKFALRGKRNRDVLNEAEIEVSTIDHFVQHLGIVPDLIKIDVDGHEGPALKGAATTLATAAPFVLLEIHKDTFLEKTGMTREDVANLLFDAGYRGLLLDDHHDLKSDVQEIHAGDPILRRQPTDMFLFWNEQGIARIGHAG